MTVCSCVVTRKQETTLLNGMGPAINAGYCSGNGQTCLEGTGMGVLGQLKSWLEDKQGHSAFWLTGFTGTGKSAIAGHSQRLTLWMETSARVSFAREILRIEATFEWSSRLLPFSSLIDTLNFERSCFEP